MEGIDLRQPTNEDFTKCETFMARVYNSNKATLDEVRVSALLACDKPEDCPPTVPATLPNTISAEAFVTLLG